MSESPFTLCGNGEIAVKRVSNRWISKELAIERHWIRRFGGFEDWAIRFGSHAVNTELLLIKLP